MALKLVSSASRRACGAFSRDIHTHAYPAPNPSQHLPHGRMMRRIVVVAGGAETWFGGMSGDSVSKHTRHSTRSSQQEHRSSQPAKSRGQCASCVPRIPLGALRRAKPRSHTTRAPTYECRVPPGPLPRMCVCVRWRFVQIARESAPHAIIIPPYLHWQKRVPIPALLGGGKAEGGYTHTHTHTQIT